MRRAAALALLLLVGAPGVARADNGWEAKFEGQSGYPTLESGETVTSEFLARNVGSKTWTPSNTLLGTANPRNRESTFSIPRVWPAANRAVAIDGTVPPGGVGRFRFQMRGPVVSSEQVFEEHFEPVADDPADSGWMGGTADWPAVYLRYTVRPPQRPTVRLVSYPSSVRRGEPIRLAAVARDNSQVDRVELAVRGIGGPVRATKSGEDSYAGSLDSGPLPPGDHTVVARAVDAAGRSAEAVATVNVYEPAPPPPPGTDPPAGAPGDQARSDCLDPAPLTVRAKLARRVVRFGGRGRVSGRVSDGAGRPAAGVAVTVRAGRRTIATGATDAGGEYAVRLPAGPNRTVVVATPVAGGAACSGPQRLRVRAGATLRLSRPRARVGQRVRFSGRVRGGTIPFRGKLVVIQVRERDGRWRDVKSLRTDRRGRYAYSYPFTRSRGRFTYRFRLQVRTERGFRYILGYSRIRRLTILGR